MSKDSIFSKIHTRRGRFLYLVAHFSKRYSFVLGDPKQINQLVYDEQCSMCFDHYSLMKNTANNFRADCGSCKCPDELRIYAQTSLINLLKRIPFPIEIIKSSFNTLSITEKP